MKREIKFRAWDNKNNQWLLNPDEIIFINQIVIPQGTGQFYVHNKNKYDIEIMQFTGLLDKNGKEIYEGDILINEFGEKVVKWDQGGFYLDEIRTEMRIYFWFIDLSKIEVIGNLYENPGLL